MLRKTLISLLVASLAACTAPERRDTYDAINSEMDKAAQATPRAATPDAVSAALLPPLQIELPIPPQPMEERFDVSFNNVPAAQFFMAIVSGTRYNMLVHPDVRGTISANLKDVTVLEALEAIRDLYGYDYRVEGNRISVRPAGLQTQVFQVNYLTGSRRGSTELRVTSTSVADVNPQGNNSQSNSYNSANNSAQNPNQNQNQTGAGRDSSKVSTEQEADFWTELQAALVAIVGGNGNGRSVVISPHSGVIVVRAMPEELRSVGSYLKAAQLSVGRQVILEAKIIEVQLNEAYQTGINWAGFRTHADSPASFGLLAPGTALAPLGAGGATSSLNNPGTIGATPGCCINTPSTGAGSLFGLALQTSNFAALLSFLESQGNVHVLSSPRIATLNNQKAVLKIGTDEFFVTNVSTTTTTGTSTVTTPSVTLQPFFSGVVLDVTPQIDDRGNVILHVRPSVSQVQTVNKSIDLGTGGNLRLPLAASNTSETDSIVRGRDGQVVAIGGLMRQATRSDRSGLPGAGDGPGLGALFRNTSQLSQKSELVILLKPTIVQDDADWAQDILGSQQRIQKLAPQERAKRQ